MFIRKQGRIIVKLIIRVGFTKRLAELYIIQTHKRSNGKDIIKRKKKHSQNDKCTFAFLLIQR